MPQEFEYTVSRIDWDSYGVDLDDISRLLNAYAKRGWEYLETVVPHTGGPVTVFRRDLNNRPPGPPPARR